MINISIIQISLYLNKYQIEMVNIKLYYMDK